MDQLTFARQLRSAQTDAEALLWSRLRAKRLFGLKFRRQQPVGPYVVDFFCAEKKLIVELDGGQHQEQAEYDASRDVWLRAEGYTVLRYWNNEFLRHLDSVLEDISRYAGMLDAPPPQPLPPQGGGTRKTNPSGR